MNVFISVDIEGCVGVHGPIHTTRSGSDFLWARRQMTREAAAAVEGALQAGAKKVLVNDSHGTKSNLILDELPRQAEVIVGDTKKLAMMEGIDENMNAALYIGYHTGAGVAGTISHTMTGRFYEIRMNGEICSEFDINAAVAGQFGVKSVLISGDDRLEESIKGRYPSVHCVVVKEYRGRCSNKNSHPEVACERIKAGTLEALSEMDSISPITVDRCEFEVDFLNEIPTDDCSTIPGVEKIGDRSVRFETQTPSDAYIMLRLFAKLILGGSQLA